MSLNEQGIPSLKDLYCGVTMHLGSARNRHLALAAKRQGLENHSLYITLMEEEIDEEEWEEEEEDEESPNPRFQVAGNFITLDDSEDDENDEDDEDLEYCTEYPHGCEECGECVCLGEEDEPVGHNVEPILRLVLIHHAEILLDETHPLLDEPAFIRFLNQVTETHDL